ncbi:MULTISPECIES: hypothetical protein [Chryseobacterium]|uniref:Lipoprotein n=1 Tax=Chryseobacterium indologenes TaxID=253 RepID=A0A411DKX0_CHRID|nr:hypothetical protein EU348_07470 [Chryseobacterium indologenes]
MNRKTFIQKSFHGILYAGLSTTLLSCVQDNFNDEINRFNNDDELKKRFKPIYIINEGSDIKGRKSKSVNFDRRKIILMEFVSLGYITLNESISETNKTNKNLKIMKLNDEFSCVLFKEPIQISLPNTFTKLKFQYIHYNELSENFTKKEIIF